MGRLRFVSLAFALAVVVSGLAAAPGCDERWVPAACANGVLRERCEMLDACTPGHWDGPEDCEEELLDGAWPTGCDDSNAWVACFCDTVPFTCDLVGEYSIFCARDNC